MSTLTPSDMRFLEIFLQMQEGYCLSFSDRTFASFFVEALDVDIDEPKYRQEGNSKGKRMRFFLRTQPDYVVARLLRALWDYRSEMHLTKPTTAEMEARYQGIASRLELAGGSVSTDAIDTFTRDETLEELVAAIQRDVNAGKAETALDRLHTYCMKRFAHLIAKHDPGAQPGPTLHARLGQYLATPRRNAKTHHPISFKIMRSAIETLELFNDVRNNRSLAHDNVLIGSAEARFVFEAIVNILRFIKATEGQAFEGK